MPSFLSAAGLSSHPGAISGDAWKALGFDDSAWVGATRGTYGDANIEAIIPGAKDIIAPLTPYPWDYAHQFRQLIELSGYSAPTAITLTCASDDSASYWLDGTLLGSSGYGEWPKTITVDPALLADTSVPHLLAVQLDGPSGAFGTWVAWALEVDAAESDTYFAYWLHAY